MKDKIADEELRRFSEFVAETTGLHFPPSRWPDLRRGISVVSKDLKIKDETSCVRWLMSAPLTNSKLEVLADSLTIGETYFFREPGSFEIFTDAILRELIRARKMGERRLRIWSAACCTGEEPYSIAIALRRMIPDWEDWNVTLLATNINSRFLRRAEAGLFGQWSFRNAPAGFKERYFRPAADGRYKILPEIRGMVEFGHLNLVKDVYPSLDNDTNAMDVIFCRNVLMYFTAAQIKKVIQKLYRAQTEGGWLIVGSSELSPTFSPPYVSINLKGVILYHKEIPGTQTLNAKAADIYHRSEATVLPFEPTMILAEADSFSPPVQAILAGEEQTDAFAQAAGLYGEGRFSEAVEKLRGLPPNNTQKPVAFGLLARSLANMGNLGEAAECCDQWIAVDKLNAAGHYLRAVIFEELGRIEDAVLSLRRVLYLDQNFVLAHFALGKIARTRGKADEAARHLQNALQLSREFEQEDILPESEGITAGRFAEIINALMSMEPTD